MYMQAICCWVQSLVFTELKPADVNVGNCRESWYIMGGGLYFYKFHSAFHARYCFTSEFLYSYPFIGSNMNFHISNIINPQEHALSLTVRRVRWSFYTENFLRYGIKSWQFVPSFWIEFQLTTDVYILAFAGNANMK